MFETAGKFVRNPRAQAVAGFMGALTIVGSVAVFSGGTECDYSAPIKHTVSPGDQLYELAGQVPGVEGKLDYRDVGANIAKHNDLLQLGSLTVGQQIELPTECKQLSTV